MIVSIGEEWFKDSKHKRFVADQLRELICREYSVLPQDIGTTAANISITTTDGHQTQSDCIAIYDQTYGSLRLTERTYTDFTHLLERLSVAAESEKGSERKYYRGIVERLKAFEKSLQKQMEVEQVTVSGREGECGGLMNVFTPGSRVGLREKGVLFSDIEIITPTIMPDGKLWYQVKCPPRHSGLTPTKRWVNPEFIETTAVDGEWNLAMWDPDTQEYVIEKMKDV